MRQDELNEDPESNDSLIDLEVTTKQAEDTKAGTGAHSSGMGAGKVTVSDLLH